MRDMPRRAIATDIAALAGTDCLVVFGGLVVTGWRVVG
jgi:hypothetical protein